MWLPASLIALPMPCGSSSNSFICSGICSSVLAPSLLPAPAGLRAKSVTQAAHVVSTLLGFDPLSLPSLVRISTKLISYPYAQTYMAAKPSPSSHFLAVFKTGPRCCQLSKSAARALNCSEPYSLTLCNSIPLACSYFLLLARVRIPCYIRYAIKLPSNPKVVRVESTTYILLHILLE